MIRVKELKNKLRVVMEKTNAQSVYVGVWVRAGSGDETTDEWGVSHFAEHMVFKGTKNRTAQMINEETDSVGGQSNAFTSKDCTCFYSRTLPEYMELSFDILSDIYHNALMRDEDANLERSVIKEEIRMLEDCPEDLVQDRLIAEIYGDHPLGREIAGTCESVEKIDGAFLKNYLSRYYTPDNTVLTVSGAFDEDEAVRLAEKYFEKSFETFSGARITRPIFTPAKKVWTKEVEQAHLCLTYPSIDAWDDKKGYSLSALSNIFGGSMSSRIFRSVREERGLCYSIYSYSAQGETAGTFSIYTGLNPSCVDAAEKVINSEIKRLLKDGVTDSEVSKGKAQLKAAVLMELENPASRMTLLGKDLLIYDTVRSVEEIIEEIDSVTKTSVEEAAHMVFESECARGLITPDAAK